MPLDYSGVYSAAQAPSAAPGLTVIPDFRLPISGEPVAVATSLYQWAKATADGLAYSWRTASGGYLAAILARSLVWAGQQTWTGLTFFTRTATFSGDLDAAGTQSDITPSIVFDVFGGGLWKLVERASDGAFPADAKSLRYVAGHGAGSNVGAETFVQNAVWDATGALWSCIDTASNCTRLVLYPSGWVFQYHVATGGTFADGDWVSIFNLDGSTDIATFVNDIVSTNGNITASAGNATARRLTSNGATLNAGGSDFALGTDWGVAGLTKAVSGTDIAGDISIHTGVAPIATPQFLFTFSGGTFGAKAPKMIWSLSSVSNPARLLPVVWVCTSTTCQVTYSGTPLVGENYTFSWLLIGLT